MEYITFAGKAVHWLLITILLLTVIGILDGGTIEVGEVTNVYGAKTTQIRW